MVRLVLDTSVIVAALRSGGGASNALLRRVALREIDVLASPALFLEYEAVLKRPEQPAAHRLSIEEIDRFLASLASTIEPVSIHFAWRPQLADPSDEMVLEAAVNGRADALVTFNERDFAAAGRLFGLPILTPAKVLREFPT